MTAVVESAAIVLVRTIPALVEIITYFWNLDETFYNLLRHLPALSNIRSDEKQGVRGLSFLGLLNGLSYSMMTTSATLLTSNLFQGLVLLISGFLSLWLSQANVSRLDEFRKLTNLEMSLLVVSVSLIVVVLAFYDQVLAYSIHFG